MWISPVQLSCALIGAACLVAGVDVGKLREELTAKNISALFPEDASYQNATEMYNLRLNIEPLAVTVPISSDQVSMVVIIGRENNLSVTARSGGHSYIGNGLGGTNGSLVIDLSQLREITVDRTTGVASIGSGNRLEDIVEVLNKEGKAFPHGRCLGVGIGGHSAFGGWGFASRMWGMTLDTVVSATVVLANGSIVSASNNNNTDLFWAIRGAAPSFGITTSINFQTHDVPSVSLAYQYSWNLNNTMVSQALKTFQAFVLDPSLPAEIGFDLGLLPGTENGTVGIYLFGAYYGGKDSYDTIMEPFLSTLPAPSVTNVSEGTWEQTMDMLAVAPNYKDTFYAKSLMTPTEVPMSDKAIDELVNYLAYQAFGFDGSWHIEVELYGGENSYINQVSLKESSFAHRNTLFTLQMYVSATNNVPPFPDAGYTLLDEMVNKIVDNMPPDWDYGAYPNYIDARLDDWQHLYYKHQYPRLQKLKAQLDPQQTFTFPLSVQPALSMSREHLTI